MDRDRGCAWRYARSSPATASAQSAPPTKEPGKLIVGFDLPAPGFWNGRASGTTIKNPSGFEYAALEGDREGSWRSRSVEFLRSPFGGLFSPAPKKYDFAFEEVDDHAQRAKVVGFSTPYFDANQGVLIAKGLSRSRRRIADLKSLQTCAQKDTTGLSVHPAQAAAGEEAARLLGIVDGRVRCGRGRALRRADPRRADRRLAEQEEAGRVRRRRRADRHGRVLWRSDGEGQQARALRRQGDQDAARPTGRSASCRRSWFGVHRQRSRF